jgi:hypothetical protein
MESMPASIATPQPSTPAAMRVGAQAEFARGPHDELRFLRLNWRPPFMQPFSKSMMPVRALSNRRRLRSRLEQHAHDAVGVVTSTAMKPP